MCGLSVAVSLRHFIVGLLAVHVRPTRVTGTEDEVVLLHSTISQPPSAIATAYAEHSHVCSGQLRLINPQP